MKHFYLFIACVLFTHSINAQWNLNGNAGITASNFLGTTDNATLYLKTNNTTRMRFDGNGIGVIGSIFGNPNSVNTMLYVGASGRPSAIEITNHGGTSFTSTSGMQSYNTCLTTVTRYGTYSKAGGRDAVNIGLYGEAHSFTTGNFNDNYGVKGFVDSDNGLYNAYGVHGEADNDAGGNSYGVYAKTTNSSAGPFVFNYALYATSPVNTNSYAGYFAGKVTVTGTFVSPSDARFKKDVKPLTNALDKLMLLNPTSYQFKTEEYQHMHFSSGTRLGFIAQEVQNIFPDLVSENGQAGDHNEKGETITPTEKYLAVNYIEMIPVIVAAIKEQQVLIEKKDKQIAVLQKDVEDLKTILRLNTVTNTTASATSYLMQNTPNPFSEKTTIQFYVEENFGTASLTVFGTDGKIIKTFGVKKHGLQHVEFEKNLESDGFYFYSLVVDGKVADAKQMMVK
ncbi:MAG TPA: tail fiber domain-containing protein [Bacteroidia bacterium]|nr:tail fiber domain-containing protein [Bacteroidia bacterium]HNU32710.1 tail fiber domain-containing protein [Bacteroidia bacterium]